MTRPGKLERNPNHSPSKQPEVAKWIKSHNKFVGSPAAVHLHLVGQRWHLKLGKNKGSRMNFTQTNETEVKAVITALKTEADYKNKPGAAECIKWCEQPANKRV